jgi:4,5-DOPA dioxygenase extradiol
MRRYLETNNIQREYFRKSIFDEQQGKSAQLAFYTPEHFFPLLYVLGASREDDEISIWNDSCMMGSISMTSYLFE